MASLLDLGADLDIVRQAVESTGCKLEITREEKSHIMATRARVISDRRYQSVSEAVSILQGSSLAGIALEKCASCPGHTGRGREPGAWGAQGRGQVS